MLVSPYPYHRRRRGDDAAWRGSGPKARSAEDGRYGAGERRVMKLIVKTTVPRPTFLRVAGTVSALLVAIVASPLHGSSSGVAAKAATDTRLIDAIRAGDRVAAARLIKQ